RVLSRWLLPALACFAAVAQAQGYISRKLDMPVPGGGAVGGLGTAEQAPRARFDGHRVMVVRDSDGQWIAIVGIALDTAPGSHALQVQGREPAAFQVRDKEYAAQHIKLKNRRQVTPNPDDLKRIERELEAQMAAYRNFRDGVVPSNVLLDLPVDGRPLRPVGPPQCRSRPVRNPLT